MNTEKARVRVNEWNQLCVDIYTDSIKDLQEAILKWGGKLVIYWMPEINSRTSYHMSYYRQQGDIHFMIYGVEISYYQYELQMEAWNGRERKTFQSGTQLVLCDDLYFLPTCLIGE